MKILTNHPGQKQSQTWNNVTKYIQVRDNKMLSVIINVIKLHANKRNYDAIVLGAGRSDIFYLLVDRLLFNKNKKCIIIDCLWYKHKNPLYHYLKKKIFKFIDVSVSKYVVWASREIEAYSNAFDLPAKKFVYIPYHHTINNYNIIPTFGDYLFSGGNFGRDYDTLIKAVDGLPVKLLIACNRTEIFQNKYIPDNVEIVGFNHNQYLEKMAGCYINIVALAPNLLHSGGQQTFLNSMYLGKPTIVLDPEGASDYITDGVDGILVEPGNSQKLKYAILDLMKNPSKAYYLGANARHKATMYSTEAHFSKIVELVKEIC